MERYDKRVKEVRYRVRDVSPQAHLEEEPALMPPRDSNIDFMIDELTNLGRELTPWEVTFLETVSDQWVRTRSLTNQQYAKLQEIYHARVR